MNNQCQAILTDKRAYIKELGKILVNDYGKQKFYKPAAVKKSHKKSSFADLDFSCWGMCIFSSHEDFDTYHKRSGEICDYVEMKREMLIGLSNTNVTNWLEIPDILFDASWLDIGEFLGDFVFGIVEFFGSIFD